MFLYNSSSTMRPPRSISSRSSSTFSSRNFTQSDTEAEEEKKFQKRIVHRRDVQTPLRMRWDWDKKEMLASCSTPKSSQEELLCRFNFLDETSVYFRPQPNHQQQRHGNKQRQKRGKCQQKQQQQIDDYFHAIRRRNPCGRRRDFKMAESNKTPTKQQMPKHLRGAKRHSKTMERAFLEFDQLEEIEMAAEEEKQRDEEKCSSPILLDFRRNSAGSDETQNVSPSPPRPAAVDDHHLQNFSSQLSPRAIGHSSNLSPLGRHHTVSRRIRMKHKMMKREALLKRSTIGQDEDGRQQYTNLPLAQIDGNSSRSSGQQEENDQKKMMMINCNSDSGMEEKLEEDDDQTQFVNISGMEKIYENLPPIAASIPPLPPTSKLPRSSSLAIVLPQQLAEDFPALYARLVALAFLDARNECRTNERGNSSVPSRRIRLAQKQISDLVGLRLGRSTELNTSADNDETFRRKCAEFCSQLAQKLRNTEAHSRKEFGWQTKKLQKILHQLRTDGQNGEGILEGTLHKLFRRIFRK